MKFLVLAFLSIIVSPLFAQLTVDTSHKVITAAELDYRKDGNNYLLVLKRGQPVIASLVAFMQKEKLPGASISGIGAVQHAEVAYYDLNEKNINTPSLNHLWKCFR